MIHADPPHARPRRSTPAGNKSCEATGQRAAAFQARQCADLPALAALGLVGADMLKRAGMNVDVQATDWGSVIQRRAGKEPVEKGGWSVFFTSFFGLDQFTPATHLGLRANGAAGWFGWCDSPKLEALREEWLRAPDLPAQQAVAARIQEQAFSDVPYLPLGEYSIPTATRKEVSGVLKGLPLFWGVQKGGADRRNPVGPAIAVGQLMTVCGYRAWHGQTVARPSPSIPPVHRHIAARIPRRDAIG